MIVLDDIRKNLIEAIKLSGMKQNEIAKKLNNDQIKKLILKRKRENGKR